MQRTKSIMTILSAALILSACQASSSSSPPTATTTTSTTPTTHTALALPPMPDTTTNNATVAGVDSNGDGIRDDVEIWISQTWQPGTPKYYAARQLARTTQQEISQVNNINGTNKNDYMAVAAKNIECSFNAFPDNSERDKAISDVMAQILNTSSRIIADQEVNHKMAGAISTGYHGSTDPCENK